MSTPPEPIEVEYPTQEDVARLLRARTKDDAGVENEAWTDDTRPTAAAVEELIQLAAGDVLSQTGAELLERPAAAAKTMIALRAAMFVELSYWPEQVRTDRSAYHEYERLYNDGMEALLVSIEGGGVAEDSIKMASLPLVSSTTMERGSGTT